MPRRFRTNRGDFSFAPEGVPPASFGEKGIARSAVPGVFPASFAVLGLFLFCLYRSGKGDCSECCTGVFLSCRLLFSACFYSACIVRGKGDCSERCTGVFLPCHLLFSACFYSACIVRGKGIARSAAPVFFCRVVCCSRPASVPPASFGEKGIARSAAPVFFCRVVCCSRFVSVLPVSFGERGFYERMYSKCPHCLSFGDAVLRGIGNYGRAGSVLFRFWTGGCGIIPAYPEAVASVPYFCTVIFFLSVPAEKSGAGKDDSRFRSQGSRCDRCKVGRIPEAGAADVLKSKRGTNRGD